MNIFSYKISEVWNQQCCLTLGYCLAMYNTNVPSQYTVILIIQHSIESNSYIVIATTLLSNVIFIQYLYSCGDYIFRLYIWSWFDVIISFLQRSTNKNKIKKKQKGKKNCKTFQVPTKECLEINHLHYKHWFKLYAMVWIEFDRYEIPIQIDK